MKLLAAGLAGLLVLTSCRAPALTQDQIRDPSLVAQACEVDPIGFDRRLVVRSPAVSFPSRGDVFPASARLFGILDDGTTSFTMLIVRSGSDWRWIRVSPDLTLPGDTAVRAARVATEVGYGGSVSESFAWRFTRQQLEAFARDGFVGDIAAGPRVSFPAALFAGFLSRWDEEAGAMADG